MERRLVPLIAAAFLLTSSVVCQEFTITLDADDKYNITWSYTGTSLSDDVTFTVVCATTGWVGIGLSPNGGMAGADIAVAWVADGQTYLQDMHASAEGLPSLDSTNDLTLLSSSELNGVTTISFKRKINTCDSSDDNTITQSTTRVIYAYGSTDPANNELTGSDYHGANRGAKSVYLLDPAPDANSIPDNSLAFDMVLSTPYEIPARDTTYYCSFFEPPVLSAKHHIVAAEPLVQAGNEGLVHHVVVYACWGLANEHIRGNNKTEGDCFGEEMPEFAESCRSVMYAWAIGGSKYYFPDVTGYPIGGSEAEDGSPQYFMMETHYDNPSLISGRSDSSGIRFHYTPTLREHDSATLQIGNIYGIFVPPKVDDFQIVAYCDSSCSQQWIPEGGVTVFSYMLHAHLLGVGIKVEHYRNGESLGIFARDDAYDFNYQEGRSFVSPKKVLAGDSLKITCTYNSATRTSITYGGEASSAEMCLAFLMYYPKQPVANCESYPSYVYSNNSELFTQLNIQPQYNGWRGVSLEASLAVVDFSDSAQVSSAQQAVKSASHITNCKRTGGDDFEVNNQPIDQSMYPDSPVEDDNHCADNSGSKPASFSALAVISSVLCGALLLF